MESSELKDWTYRQLQYKSVTLRGRIDGLVDYRRTLYEQLQKTVQDIANLEELRRSVDIDQDQDTLEHLRKRELDLRQEVGELSNRIHELSEELDPINLELAGRPPGDPEMDRHLSARRKESERQIKKVVRENEGLLEKIRRFFVGDF